MRLVFDAGPLISLENTCMLWVLESLPYQFYIPRSVYSELVLNPSHSKRFLLSAVRIDRLISSGRIRVRDVSPRDVERLLHVANHTFWHHGRPLAIIHRGEAEAVVLASRLDGVVCIDERTMRELIEDPWNIARRYERRFGSVRVDRERLEELQEMFKDILVVRSTELLAYAYELGNFIYGRDLSSLKGALYALKYAGCSVSEAEIEWYVKSISEGRRRPIWKK